MTDTSAPKIKTRFLIISDTHSATPLQNAKDKNNAFGSLMPKVDVLLHCGDLTMFGQAREYEKTLSMLEEVEAHLKLVIAGNHDVSLDESYCQGRGSNKYGIRPCDPDLPRKAREMWLGERVRRAGVTYLEEGTHHFTLTNGAQLRVYASPYQPEFCGFAFAYSRNQDRFNPSDKSAPGVESIAESPVPDFPDIDVMMTHGPPLGILDAVRTGESVGCENLLRAARRCKPKLHCFGHIHEGWGAQLVRWTDSHELDRKPETHFKQLTTMDMDKEMASEEKVVHVDTTKAPEFLVRSGRDTLMVNASIMTVTYKPWNKPFLVDLDLERAV